MKRETNDHSEKMWLEDGCTIELTGEDHALMLVCDPNNDVLFAGTKENLKLLSSILFRASKYYPQLRDLP